MRASVEKNVSGCLKNGYREEEQLRAAGLVGEEYPPLDVKGL